MCITLCVCVVWWWCGEAVCSCLWDNLPKTVLIYYLSLSLYSIKLEGSGYISTSQPFKVSVIQLLLQWVVTISVYNLISLFDCELCQVKAIPYSQAKKCRVHNWTQSLVHGGQISICFFKKRTALWEQGYVDPRMEQSFLSVRLFGTPWTVWTVAFQAPLSMEFSRQEYWNGLPFPSPGDLPDPGTEPASSCLVGRFFTIRATREVP